MTIVLKFGVFLIPVVIFVIVIALLARGINDDNKNTANHIALFGVLVAGIIGLATFAGYLFSDELESIFHREQDNTVIIDKGPDNEPSELDAKSVDDVYSPDEDYFFTYNGHTYCFYDVHTIDVNKYGNVTDASKGAYKNVQQFCKDQGGHLAIIDSVEENEKLFDETQERYDHTVFFGLSDENKEDRWIWVDGHENTLKLWSFKAGYQQPDNGHGYTKEHYAEFDYDRYNPEGSDNTGKWNDAAYLKNTSIFICEWDFILEGV